MAKKKRKKTNPVPETDTMIHKKDIAGLSLIALSLIGFAGYFNFSVGTVGLIIKQALKIAAGGGYIPLLILLTLAGIKAIRGDKWRLNARFWGVAVLFCSLQVFLHSGIPLEESFAAGMDGRGGGLTGAALGYAFKYGFGTAGTYIMLSVMVLAGSALCAGGTSRDLLLSTWNRLKELSLKLWHFTINFLFVEVKDEAENKKDKEQIALPAGTPQLSPEEVLQPVIEVAPRPAGEANMSMTGEETSASEPVAAGTCSDNPQQPVKEKIENNSKKYHMPPLTLLNPPQGGGKNTGKNISGKISKLEQILESFGIKAKVINVSVGPAITRYELQPPPGIKVSKIVGLADDIALGMATTGVRIEAPIPGKAAVGIEVPNGEVDMVTLRELLETREFSASPSRLTVALGKDIAGTPILADLAQMPHLLIAGATGSGKSVCINTIISSILFKAAPDEVKFLMVDPKMVELANYNDIPHLVSPVVTDPKKAAGALRWAVREMESRYDLFAAAGVRDITRYNSLFGEFELEPGQTPLPYIVVIIDELADLMMVAPADVEDSICRLAQMARAAGIHLVVATQRPSVDVITGLIKANIPSRISFAVSSQMDSRTILDMGGAEKLLGKGDMLFFPVGAAKPVRVQGAFLSDKEVENLVDFLKDQARPVYNEEVLKEQPGNEKAIDTEFDDELLPQAAKIFIESGTASISMLQRRLHIGYSRAARLVDIMERRGIVGGFEGSKPRAVLMTMEQYRQVFESKSEEHHHETRTAAS